MAEKSAEASPSESCSPQEEKPSGNWWDSWISTAKSKSAEVYTMVKKDLDEIGSAVKNEASHVLSSTSNVVSKTLKLDVPESPANVMKKSFSTFIGQVSTVLNPEPDDEDDTEVILSSGDTTMLSTYKKELEKIQRLDATFIVPPLEAEFDAWYASLESSESGLMSPAAAHRRLETSPLLAAQYNKLVPDAVSHEQFWERYLFRVALLQDRLAAAARKQPAATTASDPVLQHLPLDSETPSPISQSPKKVVPTVDESDKSYDTSEETAPVDAVVAWEDEDFAADVELTEEQQILLLEEYEREIASKKQSKTRDTANNNIKTTSTNTDNSTKTKSAQTRDKMNNTAVKKSPAKATVEKKVIDNKKVTSNKKVIDNKKVTDNKKGIDNKKVTDDKNRSPKKSPKTDVCGNDLVEDHFAEKDDASANSDESWEKEFEIDDVEQKA